MGVVRGTLCFGVNFFFFLGMSCCDGSVNYTIIY